MFSGGIGSWAAARRVRDSHPDADIHLIFADTAMEDDDLYRFLHEAAKDIGGRLIELKDGRTPWEIFHDVRFLGNTRADPCSRILKRELIREYVELTYAPDESTIYLGIDWSEVHRLDRVRSHWEPFRVEAPMVEPPYLNKDEMLDWLSDRGITPPRLYEMGFPHNNCGGFCIKAGQAHFKLLWQRLPERYMEHERKEQRIRKELGDVAILRDRRGGVTRPMTLREFRGRIQSGDNEQIDLLDWGGCGCFVDVEE